MKSFTVISAGAVALAVLVTLCLAPQVATQPEGGPPGGMPGMGGPGGMPGGEPGGMPGGGPGGAPGGAPGGGGGETDASAWPEMTLQDMAVQYALEESHYHIRKGRFEAPQTYGSEYEMPAAMGYAQWAYAMQIDNDSTTATADHLVLEHGASYDVPYGHTPRCKWCGCAMPASLTHWPLENGEKVVECPRCGARDSFPIGLVLRCPECHDVVAGTMAGGARCPTCGHRWGATRKACSNCGLQVSMTRRAGQTCPRCKVKWGHDVPSGNYPQRSVTPVSAKGEGHGEQCEAYSAVTGRRCPNKTLRAPAEGGPRTCWLHRHQAKTDEVAARGPVAAAAGGGAPAGGGMPGMGGGMPAMGGGMPGMDGGGMPGMGPGPSGPPGAGGAPPGAPPGAPSGGGGGGDDGGGGGGDE